MLPIVLQAAVATPDSLSTYQRFIAASAKHLTLLALFLPAPAQLLVW